MKKIWRKFWAHWYYRVLFYIIFILFSLLITGLILMEKLLFPAPQSPEKAGNITLRSNDELLDALYLPKKSADAVILYSHGNAETLSSIKPRLYEFYAHNYSVLAYDYAGYGNSTGKPGEKQAYMDIESAYRFLTQQEKIPPEKIIVAGYSVGSGPSSYLATEYPVKGLLLIAPFASAAQVKLPFTIPFDRFNNARRLKNKATDLLIFHGTNDRIIPLRNSRKIFQQSSGSKKLIVVPGAGHNDILKFTGNSFWQELKNSFPAGD